MPASPALLIPQKLLLAFTALVMVVLASTGIVLAQLYNIQDATSWTRHTFTVLETADEVRAAMVDQQTGVRGYLESGREEFLAPFERGRAVLAKAGARLRVLTRDNPAQQARLDRLDAEIAAWHRDYAEPRRALPANVMDEALAAEGKRHMDAIRTVLAEMVAAERGLLEQRAARQLDAFATAYWATGLGGLALLLVAWIAWGVLSRGIARPIRQMITAMGRLAEDDLAVVLPPAGRSDELGQMASALHVFRTNALRRVMLERQKADADRAVRLSEARLQGIFASVREGILTCDAEGRVETANAAAMRLFGLPAGMVPDSVHPLLHHPGRPGQPLDLGELLPEGASALEEVETVGLRADGTAFAVELAVSRSEVEGEALLTLTLRDITARKEVERLKNEFVSTVSHELRTPLTSIRGALGLVTALGAMLPEKARGLIEIAHRNAERLIALVNDILDMEKIQSGKMEFALGRTELYAAAHEAVESNRTYAANRNVTLRLVAWMDPLPVVADTQRLQQVLANLLSNAIKFSNEGDTVTVSVAEELGRARVTVHDTGPGVPAAFRDRIFQKFAQADSADTRSKGGSGLGLSITKAIVERHGGEVGFTSEPGDTRFHVWLPLAPAEAAAGLRPCPVEAEAPSRRLLIVEDDPDIARLLRFMVERAGLVADVALDARAAREALAARAYSAMTLDLKLPDEDGVSLFRSLRRDPRTRDLPILVISATAEAGRRELNGDAVGIVDFLEKPINERRLEELLRGHLDPCGNDLPRVLYVEDDPDLRHLVEDMLAGRAEVVGAPDLATARARLSQGCFGLVILDIGLGSESGLDLLPVLSSLQPPPPVLVFSAQQVGAEVSGRISCALVKSRTSNEELARRILEIVNQQTKARNG